MRLHVFGVLWPLEHGRLDYPRSNETDNVHQACFQDMSEYVIQGVIRDLMIMRC
jgi:hypothetical protein